MTTFINPVAPTATLSKLHKAVCYQKSCAVKAILLCLMGAGGIALQVPFSWVPFVVVASVWLFKGWKATA